MSKKWITEEIPTNRDLEVVYYSSNKNKVINSLPTVSNIGSSNLINQANKNYISSKKKYENLEKDFREKAKQNDIILPYKTGEHTSISAFAPTNFTILKNSKTDENNSSKDIISYNKMNDIINNKKISKVDSFKTSPLDLDITPKLKSGLLNKQKYDKYASQDNVKKDLENLREARNTLALDEYNLNLEKVNNHDTNFYDKTLGRFINGGISMLPNLTTTYTRDDGIEVNLPSYTDLKEQKTIQNYDTGIGKFAGDVTYNIGRIATSAAINKVLPFAGTIAYFGDMFTEQYNNNLLNGYDANSSLLHATIGTATEAVTEKILGGLSKQLFKGNSSELSSYIAKGINKLTKNKIIINFFSNASSEAIEEFVQTYTEKLNDDLILEKKLDPDGFFSKDKLSEAIYSAGVGFFSGGLLNIGNSENELANNQLNLENNANNIEATNNANIDENIDNKTLISKYNENNENINIKKYIAKPSENQKINQFRNSVQNSNAIDNFKTEYVMNTIEKVISDKNYNILFDSTITNKNGKSVDGLIKTNANNEIEIRLNPNSNRSVEFLLAHEITHSIETTELKDLVLNFASKNSKFNEDLKSLQKIYGTSDVSSEVLADISGQLLGNQEFINNLKLENSTKSKNIIKNIYESIKKLLNNLTEKGKYRNFIKNLESKWAEAYKTITTEQSIEKLKNDEKYALLLYNKINKATEVQNKRISDAYKLQKKGYNEDFIWSKTGVRFIDNQDALFFVEDLKFKKDINLLNLKPGKYALNEIMEGPLLENIRQLKNLNFKLIDFEQEVLNEGVSKEDAKKFGDVAGSASLDDGISINIKYINKIEKEQNPLKIIENILSHEIQHVIQSIEYGESKTTAFFNYDEKTKKIIYTETNPTEAKYKYRNNPKEIEAEVTRIQNAMSPEQRRKIPLNLLFNEVKSYYKDKNNLNPIKPQSFINQLFGKYGYNLETWYNDIKAGDTNELFKSYDYGNRENIKEQNNEVVSFRRNQRDASGKNRTSDFGNASLFITESGNNIQGSNTISDEIKLKKNEELDNSSFSFAAAKQYDDLIKTNYIEYFRKNNGDVKVYLMDSNNNLLNEFSLWSNTNAIKELGENLGNKIYETAADTNQRIDIGNDINNLGTNTDYFMNHRPSEGYGNASNFEENMPGVFEHPEWYLNLHEKYNKESLNVLKKIRNNPEAELTIYRATIGNKINSGDWVTPSKSYAEYHNNSQFDGKGNIIGMKVKAKDIQFAGDDINEWGYFPNNTKYSIQEDTNNSWQKHLEENYKARGTTTKFSEFILPTFKDNTKSANTNEVLPKYEYKPKNIENKIPSFMDSNYASHDASKVVSKNDNELKIQNKMKIDNNNKTINKLIEARNETLKNIDKDIKNKREIYNIKKNKNTKIANLIQQQIISMEARKKAISGAYKQRIERLDDRNSRLSSKENYTNIQRKSKAVEYRELFESIIIDNISTWKDKEAGWKYKTDKMERNIHDIIPDKNVANTIIDTCITPLKIAEANQKKFINEYVNKIKKLNLSNEEAVAVQMLGESKFNISNMEADSERAYKILNRENVESEIKSNAQFYLDTLDYIKNNDLDLTKIQNNVKEFRKIYNELFEKINNVLEEQGYKKMDYKENYFPHFTEEHATSKIGKLMEKLGWKKFNNSLPTNIAGLTDTFKPGKTYFNHLEHRYGNITEYNALKGFDNYISGASNLIFLTEPIQKLRAFENEIRYLHSDKAIQEKYNEIIKSDVDYDTKGAQITQLFDNYHNPLNNFVTELRSYTDGIANKKSELDRRLEQSFNRNIYGTMTNIQNRASANMVGLNISSALTNFIPITQAYSQVSTKNILKAIKSTITNSINSDNFVDNSEFLSNRLIQSEKLYKTKLEKVSEKANIIFDAIDSFTSNVVTRAKYYENIDKGMNPTEALKNADTFANNVMAGRDKASLPTAFNSKNPFIKLFTSFQLEVNNQYKYMLKDLPSDLKDEGLSKLIGAFAKMFFGAWFYNMFAEKITGRKSAFSPADIVLDSINTIKNDNGSFFDKTVSIMSDIGGELPFVGNLLGGGRLPISSALPDASNTIDAISTLSNKNSKVLTKKTALKNLIKELSKPVYYIIPPFGGGQLKKSIEGVSMYVHQTPGSYTPSGKLRFTAEKGILPVTQAVLFGQYASKNAREYFDNSYTPLTEKQIEEFETLNVGIDEYRTYLSKYKEISKIGADKDSNGDPIPGTAKAKKIYEIINNKEEYSEKEIEYILSKLSTEKEKITLDEIILLNNNIESYKYYFSLSNKSKDKYKTLILNNSLNQDTYINSISKIKRIKEKYDNVNNPYTGEIKNKYKQYLASEKKKEIFNVINEENISKPEKIILFEASGYSISNYKKYMFTYINSLNISKNEKIKMWKYLYSE